jgi:ribosomal protein S18 acetylase RimI-like enzyme
VNGLLERIDAYCDAIPRGLAAAEEVGSLVLFVRRGEGHPYYARPRRGGPEPAAADVALVRTRQRSLGLPESFEWIDEVAPAMRAAAVGGGLAVADHPLLVHAGGGRPVPPGHNVALVEPDDERLPAIAAVAGVAFAHPGTAAGPEGRADLARATARRSEATDEELRGRLRDGRAVLAAGFLDGEPVATGMHLPLDGVTEIVGVGTLPVARRRGYGAAVTAALLQDALRHGAGTVFLAAGDEEIARVYESLGFARAGTACIAEPPFPVR